MTSTVAMTAETPEETAQIQYMLDGPFASKAMRYGYYCMVCGKHYQTRRMDLFRHFSKTGHDGRGYAYLVSIYVEGAPDNFLVVGSSTLMVSQRDSR